MVMRIQMDTLLQRVLPRSIRSVLTVATAAGLAFASLGAAASELQTLKNMERERAQLVATFIESNLGASDRQQQVAAKQKRLVDLERMVLRDDALLGNTDRMVKFAFEDYDLSFLVHASADSKKMPVALWLDEVGLGQDAIMNTRVGRR
jgi:hypothetical protein